MKVYLTQDPSITQKERFNKMLGLRSDECKSKNLQTVIHEKGYLHRSQSLQGGVCKPGIKTLAPVKSGINVNSNNVIKKPAEISFGGLSSVQKPIGKWMGKFLEMAAENETVFGQAFALLLTCFLRPATIMALPGQKKNKGDKVYASAHSIASGIIGFAISLVLFNPIAKGIKKITNAINPADFLKKGSEYLMKDGKLVSKSWDTAGRLVKMLPEAFLALPRAMVTIALIPPILKYVFGIEKSANKKDMHPVIENYAAINFKSSKSKEKFQSFMGGVK